MNDTNQPGRWAAGKSGNPRGKTPGSGHLQKLRASIAADVPAILESLSSSAQAGDVQAARLLLERVLPPMKAVEQALLLRLPKDGTLADHGRAVLAAVAQGELPPDQGAQMLNSIGVLARIVEAEELVARVAALEQFHASPTE